LKVLLNLNLDKAEFGVGAVVQNVAFVREVVNVFVLLFVLFWVFWDF
jgi:hypothetical protein